MKSKPHNDMRESDKMDLAEATDNQQEEYKRTRRKEV